MEFTDLSIRRTTACLQAVLGESENAAILVNKFLAGERVSVSTVTLDKAIALANNWREEATSKTAVSQLTSAIQLLTKMREV